MRIFIAFPINLNLFASKARAERCLRLGPTMFYLNWGQSVSVRRLVELTNEDCKWRGGIRLGRRLGGCDNNTHALQCLKVCWGFCWWLTFDGDDET